MKKIEKYFTTYYELFNKYVIKIEFADALCYISFYFALYVHT